MILTFEDLVAAFDGARMPPETRRREISKLARKARTFSDWLAVYYRSEAGTETETRSLAALAQLPAERAKLLEVLEFAPEQSRLRETVVRKLSTQGATELNGYAHPISTYGLDTWKELKR